MDDGSLVMWIVAGGIGLFILIAAGLIVFLFLYARKRYREVADLPTTRVADAQDRAIAKLVGTVHAADRSIRDPISGEDCVAYHAWVACESEQTGGPRRNWSHVTLAEKREYTEFLVEDFSGVALVKPPVAMMGLRFDEHAKDELVNRFLADAEVPRPDKPIFPGGQAIRAGDRVIVVGLARRVPRGLNGETLVIEPRPRGKSVGTVWVADVE